MLPMNPLLAPEDATAGGGSGTTATTDEGAASGKPAADAGGGKAPVTPEIKVTTTEPPAKAAATTTADDAKGYWPSDWRAKAAGGDQKTLEALGRYASPAEVAKALRAAQAKISSGDLKPVLSKNPSAEELTEWRKNNDVPEDPKKYDLTLGGGVVVGDEDMPLVEGFLKVAHASNLNQTQTKAVLRAYYENERLVSEARAEEDVEIQERTEETMRSEWGPEFKSNVNRINQLLDRIGGKEFREGLMYGRMADGTPIGSSPAALKAILGLSLLENPAGIITTGDIGKGLDDELKSIEKTMREKPKQYQKDEKMQSRYRELVDAKMKMDPAWAAKILPGGSMAA